MELIDKVIQFNGKSVPLKLVAKVMGKDYQFVRIGIVEGVLTHWLFFQDARQ